MLRKLVLTFDKIGNSISTYRIELTYYHHQILFLQSLHAADVLPVVVKKIWSRLEYKEVKKEFSLSISKELFLSNLYATHWLWMLLLPKCLISDNLALIEILQLFVSSFIRLPFIFLPLLTQTSAYTKEKIKLHEMIIEAFLLGHKGVENDPDELWKIW